MESRNLRVMKRISAQIMDLALDMQVMSAKWTVEKHANKFRRMMDLNTRLHRAALAKG